MSKGGLSFLLKKSWHTGKISNAEKVWMAEKKAREEQKKLDQLKKEIDQERHREELRQLQKEAGLLPKTDERMTWMVSGPAAASERRKEEYLLGKEFVMKDEDEDLGLTEPEQSTSSSNGSKLLQKYENRDSDVSAKIRDDPLLLMMAAEKRERDEILKNPVKVKSLKKELQQDKSSGKKRRHEEDERDFEKPRTKRGRYGLIESEKDDYKPRSYRSRSRSEEPERFRRPRSLPRSSRSERDHYRSRERVRSPEKSYRHEKNDYRSKKSRYESSGRSSVQSLSQDNPRESSKYGDGKRDSHSSMNKDEKMAKLKKMQEDAERLEAERRGRLSVQEARDQQADANRSNGHPLEAQFLNDFSKQVFLETEDRLEDRITKNKHYLLRAHQLE